jgi:hypothetical protein
MKHRIITNGESFRVETMSGKQWEIEMEIYNGYSSCGATPCQFKTHKAAVKWVHKKYGTRANLLDREWRPA